MEPSVACFSANEIGFLGHLILQVFSKLHLIDVKTDDKQLVVNNFTIINFLLIKFGPVHEAHLTTILLFIQVLLVKPVLFMQFF